MYEEYSQNTNRVCYNVSVSRHNIERLGPATKQNHNSKGKLLKHFEGT